MAGYPLANGFAVTVRQHLDRERYEVATFGLLDALIPRILPGHVCYVSSEDKHYALTPGLNWRPLTAEQVQAYTDAQAQAAVAAGLDGGSETIGASYDPADTVSPLYLFLRTLSVGVEHLKQGLRDLLPTLDQKGSFPVGASATNKLALKSDIPVATGPSGNLYAGAGQNTDGPMTQKAVTDALAGKADSVLRLQATVALAAGQLVRLADGATGAVVLYDAQTAAEAGQLLGVALVAAAAGQPVLVQLAGLVTVPGWNLLPGTLYRAGAEGTLTTSNAGLAFVHVVGRAQTPDTLHLTTLSLFYL